MMRVATYNIHGARVPGKASATQQDRAWHLLATHGVDLAFVQEAEWKRIPSWAREHWTILTGGDVPDLPGTAGWGSVLAARKELDLTVNAECHKASKFLEPLSDYVLVGSVTVLGELFNVVSVHAPARRLTDHLKVMKREGAISDEEAQSIAQPGEAAWAIDLAFHAIAELTDGTRFIIAGDWNNSRLCDLHPTYRKRGRLPASTLFFTRAMDRGWHDCHGHKNDERSFLVEGTLPLQLDHMFCDRKTGERLIDCSVLSIDVLSEISDHAPLIADFDIT